MFDDHQQPIRPNIEDTSDPIWSETVQKTWPHFIMGVSETWLGLINQLATEHEQLADPDDLQTLLPKYQKINAAVDEIWKQHGRHAFLHHLNAVFGYRPLYMRY